MNVKSKLLSTESPLVMGILNVTEDSFYDGGRYTDETAVLKRAEQILREGAAIINDVSGGTFDERMPEVVGQLHVPYVLMHTTAKPDKMQQQPLGADMLQVMMQFFARQMALFKEAGCVDVILDPGFGFGKTLEQNYFLMKNLSVFHIFECPILVGISRKSMIYRLLNTSPDEALAGTVALNMMALQQGASILRVHDVREAVETVKIFNMYQSSDCQ